MNVQYVTSRNVIKLTYDEGHGIGCKNKKFICFPCQKTLKCDYFKTIFDDKPFDDIEIEVSSKQQYFINYCHKICPDCMNNLYIQNSTHNQYSECKEETIYDFSYCKELINMCLCTSFNIHDFKDFHDIYKGLESHRIPKK